VVEETGFTVEIHEYLGAISYKTGRKPKLVEFWRMQAVSKIGRKPARDIKAVQAVQWLPLDAAIARLELPLEQLFLRNVGPRALAPATEPAPSVGPPVAAPRAAPEVVPDKPVVVAAPAARRGFLQLILDAFAWRRRSRA